MTIPLTAGPLPTLKRGGRHAKQGDARALVSGQPIGGYPPKRSRSLLQDEGACRMTPSLDALLDNAAAVTEILPESIPGLLCRLATLQHLLAFRLVTTANAIGVVTTANVKEAPTAGTTAEADRPLSVIGMNVGMITGITTESDRLLTAEQAAPLMNVTVKWIYRHHRQLPFTRRLSRKVLRFSEVGLRRWLAQRSGRT